MRDVQKDSGGKDVPVVMDIISSHLISSLMAPGFSSCFFCAVNAQRVRFGGIQLPEHRRLHHRLPPETSETQRGLTLDKRFSSVPFQPTGQLKFELHFRCLNTDK